MPLEFPGTSRRRTFSRSKEDYDRKKKSGGNFFGWAILIILLIAMNAGVWTFSLIVFGYPEKPFNYRLLTKLKKLESIKSFDAYSVPRVKTLDPQKLYETYFRHTPQQLAAVNSLLLRHYIKNYDEADPVAYVRGTFRIYQAKTLTQEDFFTSGVVVRANYQEYPQVVIEYVMPSKEVPDTHFKIGDDLDIDTAGSSVFASLLHIEKLPEDKICLTLVPLVHKSSYPLSEGRSLKLAAPGVLNVDGTLPITEEAIGELPSDGNGDSSDSPPAAEGAAESP